jgi:hypothetical protein
MGVTISFDDESATAHWGVQHDESARSVIFSYGSAK